MTPNDALFKRLRVPSFMLLRGMSITEYAIQKKRTNNSIEQPNEYGTTVTINKYTEQANEYGTTVVI